MWGIYNLIRKLSNAYSIRPSIDGWEKLAPKFHRSTFQKTHYALLDVPSRLGWQMTTYPRVANIVADHDDLLTQWRPILMSKFRAKIFLIRTTSNYFWASEVLKNQRFKSHLFSFFQYKKYPKLKTWVNFYAIIILY